MNKKRCFFDLNVTGTHKSALNCFKQSIATHRLIAKHPTATVKCGCSYPTVVTHSASGDVSQITQHSGKALPQGESNLMVCCMPKKHVIKQVVDHLLSGSNVTFAVGRG